MMRNLMFIALIATLMVLMTTHSYAQFRGQEPGTPRVAESMVRSGSPFSLFSFISPENFHLRHSYTLSYITAGGRGLSLGMFTSSLLYQISDPLDVQVDVSMMHSPYNSFGMSENFSRVFISRAELNYQPSENFRIQFQYRQVPYSMYGSYYYNPWYYRYGY